MIRTIQRLSFVFLFCGWKLGVRSGNEYEYAKAKLSVAFPAEPEAIPAEDGVSFGKQYVDETSGAFYNAQIVRLEAADVHIAT